MAIPEQMSNLNIKTTAYVSMNEAIDSLNVKRLPNVHGQKHQRQGESIESTIYSPQSTNLYT